MKFKVHRKRPDVHKLELAVFDSSLIVTLARPTTPQFIALTATMTRMFASIAPGTTDVDAAEYTAAAIAAIEFITDIEGVEDEDGEPLAWADLTEQERENIALQLPLEAMFSITGALTEIHTIGAVKKKPSDPTSEMSTSMAPADAPDVSQA